ncbi:UDP-N-acetylmuramoyl-tripeptide--D-alanyl-D-alanine ligase [Amphibacillus indicireducens]|uniref:UDP-N-acetylmuramoyl-tripeptide--D-alanyl-D-alanine ligase n=1 Tax=Amphibacillus indicireducens TaxID=1076330 RepID=A0ABP7VMJ1_9BACI
MPIKKLIEQTFQQIDGDWQSVNQIVGVGTDTRTDLSNKLFVPLKGDNFDGHHFIEKAIEQGAIAALWHHDYPRPTTVGKEFPLIKVADPLIGLQELAHVYLHFVNPKVVAITGSNGKTTTKDLVYAVTSVGYQTHCTEGNFNNHIGLPLTILTMPETTEVIVLEMGMNHFGEIERLVEIAQPDLAIITNIGESHIEHLGSRTGIAKAKLEITTHFKTDSLLIYDGDESLLVSEYPFETISVGFDQSNDYFINDCQILNSETRFKLADQAYNYTVPLIGKHQAKNAVYSIVVGQQLGLSTDQIQAGLKTIEMTQMRFEKQVQANGVTLINDAYNASPTSMKATIETLAQLDGYQEKIVVLGDMFELGRQSLRYHQEVGESISSEIDFVYTIGEAAEQISQATSVPARHFTTKEALLKQLELKLNKGTVILFKASRGMKLEQVIDALSNV